MRASRTHIEIAGRREATAIAATLGGGIHTARRARRLTLEAVARRVGISRARLSEIERGLGTRAPLETWVALGIAVHRPVAISLTRALGEVIDVADAGHLRIQEHLLGLAAATGRPGTFELPTRPGDPSRSTDVGFRDPKHALRILAECWNTFGDLGAAVRSSHRKAAEAAATWPEDRIATVWVVAATAANRAILARYPSTIASAFRGSSRAWVHALEAGGPPPDEPGLVWFDPSTSRLMEHRRPRLRATMAA